MKKIFTFAVLFAMVTGAIFTQELKLDGYLNTGLGLIASDAEGEDARIQAHAIDAEQQGFRFRLNGSYTNEAQNAGVRFRLQAQSNYGAAGNLFGYFSLPHVFGWVSFFEDKINLSGGIIEDNTWVTGDWWLASDSMNHFVGLGTLLKVTPVDGLTFGAGAHIIGREGGGNNNRLSIVNYGVPKDAGDVRYVIHGGYTMPDVFRIGLSYRTNADVGGDNSSRLYADARLLAVENLTAVVAASLNNIGGEITQADGTPLADSNGSNLTFRDRGEVIISQTFAYSINDIRFGLNAAQFLSMNDANKDASLLFNLWGSYTINSLVPRLDLVYFLGGNSVVGGSAHDAATSWHRKSFNVSAANLYNNDRNLFSIRPSLRINLDNRTYFEIGNMLNFDTLYFAGTEATGTDPAVDPRTENRISNVFYIDLRWSF